MKMCQIPCLFSAKRLCLRTQWSGVRPYDLYLSLGEERRRIWLERIFATGLTPGDYSGYGEFLENAPGRKGRNGRKSLKIVEFV